jgi:CBS domain-containing protein
MLPLFLHQPTLFFGEDIMQVKEVMTHGAECIGPEESLQQAAQKMKNLDVGPLPVCGDGDRLVGILTDRDIVVRAVAEGRDPRSARVRDAMTEGIAYCFEDDDVNEAARLMTEKQIRRLVVLNRDKRLTGIVSLGDLAAETGDEHLACKTLQSVSQPV